MSKRVFPHITFQLQLSVTNFAVIPQLGVLDLYVPFQTFVGGIFDIAKFAFIVFDARMKSCVSLQLKIGYEPSVKVNIIN
jgi:hypothetical protein